MSGNAWDLPAFYPEYAYTEDGQPVDPDAFAEVTDPTLTLDEYLDGAGDTDAEEPPVAVQALVDEFAENMGQRPEPWSDAVLVAGAFPTGPDTEGPVAVEDLTVRVFVVVPTEAGFAWLPTPVRGSVALETVAAALGAVQTVDGRPNLMLLHVAVEEDGHVSQMSFDVAPGLTSKQVRSVQFVQEYAAQVQQDRN